MRAGDPLMDWPSDPHDISTWSARRLQRYLVNEIQEVYRLQGVNINNKTHGVDYPSVLKENVTIGRSIPPSGLLPARAERGKANVRPSEAESSRTSTTELAGGRCRFPRTVARRSCKPAKAGAATAAAGD